MATETEYVDAGEAVDFTESEPRLRRQAPPVAKGVNYDRILKARDAEPHNWLTYYGAYDGQRYSPLDQINTVERQGAEARVGVPVRLGGHALGRLDVLVRGVPARRRRHHVRHRLGWLDLGA